MNACSLLNTLLSTTKKYLFFIAKKSSLLLLFFAKKKRMLKIIQQMIESFAKVEGKMNEYSISFSSNSPHGEILGYCSLELNMWN